MGSVSESQEIRDTGERQLAPTLEGIRADHLERYKFAVSTIQKTFGLRDGHNPIKIIDAGCGCGYGYGCAFLHGTFYQESYQV